MSNIHNVSDNTLIIEQGTDTWFIDMTEDGIEVSGEFLTIDGYEEGFILKFDANETKSLLRFFEKGGIQMNINNYMTVKEASYRWGIDYRTLREKLNIKRRPSLQNDLDNGLVKYFKHPEAKQGEWIISNVAMIQWYGDEPIKEGEL